MILFLIFLLSIVLGFAIVYIYNFVVNSEYLNIIKAVSNYDIEEEEIAKNCYWFKIKGFGYKVTPNGFLYRNDNLPRDDSVFSTSRDREREANACISTNCKSLSKVLYSKSEIYQTFGSYSRNRKLRN